MYKAFIEPDLKLAQLRIYNKFNPFTGFTHVTYILKAHNTHSLLTIDEAEKVMEVMWTTLHLVSASAD